MERIRHPTKLKDKLTDPDTCDASLVVLFEGWADDLLRLHASLVTHLDHRSWELVVVDLPSDDRASERIAALDNVTHLPLRDPMGWAPCRNLGLRQASGRIVCVADTCITAEGDFLSPIERYLADSGVGLVGKWGVTSPDALHFDESQGPDVDGVEAYIMAMRRADLTRTGLFHPKFKWYRNADIDFSFQVRAGGWRTIIDPELPLDRHQHRAWENTPAEQRDEMSRKNFFRFRDHWGDRTDLLVNPGP